MRLITFMLAPENIPTLGMEIDNQLVSLKQALPPEITNMQSLITNFAEARPVLNGILADKTYSFVKNPVYLPPILKPGKILGVGLNYLDHADETKRPRPEYPVLFPRFPSGIVGHNHNIQLSKLSRKFDYEGELAVIIGKTAKSIKASDAADVIFGYSIFNDVTVRDYQGRSTQWLLGKNFDASGAFGPCIVTSDEIADAADLSIKTYLNDQLMQDGNSRDMIFNIGKLIETITEVMTLEPGDIISTGTPAGVGFTRTPPIYLKDGDICEIKIDRIGILRNYVVG